MEILQDYSCDVLISFVANFLVIFIFQQLAQQQNLVIPQNTEVAQVSLESQGDAIAKAEEPGDDTPIAQQDVPTDPLTVEEEDDSEDVLQYEVAAN